MGFHHLEARDGVSNFNSMHVRPFLFHFLSSLNFSFVLCSFLTTGKLSTVKQVGSTVSSVVFIIRLILNIFQ